MPLPGVLGAAGGAIGGLFNRKTEQQIPKDVQGIRNSQTDFLSNFMQALQSGNLEQFIQGSFGDVGIDQTANQKQASGGISQFLNQQSPEARALDESRGALTGIMNQNSGQGILEALQPFMDQGVANANQQGGRFGSANMLLRNQNLQSTNLLAQQALQQGQQNQIGAANIFGMLSGQAGQADFGRLLQQFGIGTQEAQQADVATQRRLGIGTGLTGMANQAAFNIPFTQSPSVVEQIAGLGGAVVGAMGGGKA